MVTNKTSSSLIIKEEIRKDITGLVLSFCIINCTFNDSYTDTLGTHLRVYVHIFPTSLSFVHYVSPCFLNTELHIVGTLPLSRVNTRSSVFTPTVRLTPVSCSR